MNYVDECGLWNVKPVGPDNKPTGNDGWIVTAYAVKCGFKINQELITKTWERLKKIGPLPIERLPNKETPYCSRDVMLGLGALKLITVDDLIAHDWKFSPKPIPKFDIFKLANQLWQLRPRLVKWKIIFAHRNYFWENNLDQIYRFAYSVPLQDRAFYYRIAGRCVPFFYYLIESIDEKLKPGSNSGTLIRWLKYDRQPDTSVWVDYFSIDHPFYTGHLQ